MKSNRFTEEQIIRISQEAGLAVVDICRKHNCSEQSFYRWRAKYGGFTVALIFSGLVGATDKDISNPERLRTMETLIRSVGYACTPMTVFDTGVVHGKHFYSVKCQDGQRYIIATPPEVTINDVEMTDAAYIAVDGPDWQKSEWMNTIMRNTESLDNISKSYPDVLE